MPPNPIPKVILFDIGGVCVASPMQAIKDYELANNIPNGWINHSISRSGANGSWARLERGEILLDSSFFSSFQRDLSSSDVWREFNSKLGLSPSSQASSTTPPPPLNSEDVFWKMMHEARVPDPSMWPALLRLRSLIVSTSSPLLLAALSNTCIFPPEHPFSNPTSASTAFQTQLRAQFDVFLSSAHIGLRKPEMEVYEYAIKELDALSKSKGGDGVTPGEILFLDDIGINLKAAREAGMRTLKVEMGRVDNAVRELERVVGVGLRDEEGAKAKL